MKGQVYSIFLNCRYKKPYGIERNRANFLPFQNNSMRSYNLKFSILSPHDAKSQLLQKSFFFYMLPLYGAFSGRFNSAFKNGRFTAVF